MVIILSKTDSLEYLLESLAGVGIKGATILDSYGLIMALMNFNSDMVDTSLRDMFSDNFEDNKTIISVIHDEQLDNAKKVVYKTVGDLCDPNTGIMFTVPIDFAWGTHKHLSEKNQTEIHNKSGKR